VTLAHATSVIAKNVLALATKKKRYKEYLCK